MVPRPENYQTSRIFTMPIMDNLIPEIKSEQTVLSKIVSQRQIRLSEQAIKHSRLEITTSDCSLVNALETSSTGFILECKKSSPSRGLLSDDYQPDNIALQYQHFASAISVLTEPDFFSGSLDDLRAVTSVVELPVLCKDFIIDTSQIYQARAAGADVILLMLSVVTNKFWLHCYRIANELGLDIITEVHNKQELNRALLLPAKIIGINNRNLHTLETDISVTKSLAEKIPPDRLIISESGISSHHQLKSLAPLVDGFLIGSSLMQSANLEASLRRLIFGEIKVCGLTLRRDADLAWQYGASYGGMIFTSVSSRCISIEQARKICNQQPMPMVGVFMDQPIAEVIDTAKQLQLNAVQLHGDEDIHYIQQLQALLPEKCQVWKAISCSEVIDVYPTIQQAMEIKNFWFEKGVQKLLIDTPKDKMDHKLDYQGFLHDDRVLIAGGLAIDSTLFTRQGDEEQEVKAGFDLCSALEKTAGIKDPEKLYTLFNNLQPHTRKYHEGK